MGLFGISKKELKQQNEELKQQKEELKSEIAKLRSMLLPEHNEIEYLRAEIDKLNNVASAVKAETEKYTQQGRTLKSELAKLTAVMAQKRKDILDVENAIEMQEYGLYKPHYVFANSDLYKAKLTEIREAQKQKIKDDKACNAAQGWEVNGSASKGNAMVRDMKKLLLRAFNLECDDIVANVKISNFEKSIERIRKMSEQISKLGAIMMISITDSYIKLKIEEVKLALDFQQKKQEEKDRLKELKEQQREAAKAQKEIEAERKKLEKEKAQYTNALSNLLSQIAKNGEAKELLEKKAELENQLQEIGKAIEDVDYRAANERTGYVYIISNIGSFGENIYKIGMTRRLDPHERVDELGDASVPFDFDIHALIFSEDAPKLEAALHKAFDSKKVNKINMRREFFNVTLDEIKAEVRKNFDKTVEWIDVAEAEQYRQSVIKV